VFWNEAIELMIFSYNHRNLFSFCNQTESDSHNIYLQWKPCMEIGTFYFFSSYKGSRISCHWCIM